MERRFQRPAAALQNAFMGPADRNREDAHPQNEPNDLVFIIIISQRIRECTQSSLMPYQMTAAMHIHYPTRTR